MHELKWKPGQTVELTLLGAEARTGSARILELSGKRMRLAADLQVNDGAAVRLDWDGQLLLGQALGAGPEGFWLEIQHMLLDTAGLSWQKKAWAGG